MPSLSQGTRMADKLSHDVLSISSTLNQYICYDSVIGVTVRSQNANVDAASGN